MKQFFILCFSLFLFSVTLKANEVLPIELGRISTDKKITATEMFALIHRQSFSKENIHFTKMNQSSLELQKNFKKLSIEKPLEVSAHVSQTILFLITMASVDLTYKKIMISTKEKPIDMSGILNDSTQAAIQIINGGNTWNSMLGAWISTNLIKYPFFILSELLVEQGARASFIDSLKKTTLTTAAFMGWDAGAQLWKEATYLLDNQDEFNRAGSLWGTGSGALSALLSSSPNNIQDRKDLSLAKKMLSNIFLVAFFNQELRSEWLNNTWRTHIMTGNFVTYLTSIISAGTIGAKIYPGGGAVAGFMFGLAGATFALVLPANIKDELTIAMQIIRNRFTLAGLFINSEVIKNQVVKSKNINWLDERKHFRPFLEMLEQRHSYRSDYITVLFEAVRLDLKQFLSETYITSNTFNDLQFSLRNLNTFLSEEQKLIANLKIDSEIGYDRELDRQLSYEIQRLTFFNQFIREFSNSLNEGLAKETRPFNVENFSDKTQALLNFIEITYHRGFSEDKLLGFSVNN
jgi:hypothetical protein